jgi:two-component system response regulator HydG/two-component system response regulator AtoC
MNRPSIWIIGDNQDSIERLKTSVATEGVHVLTSCQRPQDGISLGNFPAGRILLVIITSFSSQLALDTLCQIRLTDRALPVIMVPAKSSESQAIAAFRAGVTDYLEPPLSFTELRAYLRRCLKDVWINDHKGGSVGDAQLIGSSIGMQNIKASIKKVALTDSNVIITGETGTGKELVAELIYRNSVRNQKPFISLNCAAIPDTLLESELFGYERGAFTGAVAAQKGKFELAQGGTLFLDEIGEMSPIAQAKILRAIDTKQIFRLGGQTGRQLNVRLIAASNQPLKQLTHEGKFRKDLFFRLNVAAIDVPPLRDRREDIPALLRYFIHHFNQRWGRSVQGVSSNALDVLLRYAWPGNVRELRNVLERVIAEPDLSEIDRRDLPEEIRASHMKGSLTSEAERDRIMTALCLTQWNKSRTAQQLRWSRMTLYRKLAKYQIQRQSAVPVRTPRSSDTSYENDFVTTVHGCDSSL